MASFIFYLVYNGYNFLAFRFLSLSFFGISFFYYSISLFLVKRKRLCKDDFTMQSRFLLLFSF